MWKHEKNTNLFLLLCLLITGCGANKAENASSDNGKEEKQTQDVTLNFGERAVAENYTIELQLPVVEEEPQDGQIFVELVYEITNTSEEEMCVSHGDFEGYADDYMADMSTYTYLEATKNLNLLTGTIASGKKIKGFVPFRVQEDFQVFEAKYTDKDGNHITYIINRNQFEASQRD